MIGRLHTIAIKVIAALFAEVDKLFLKFTWKYEEQNNQNNFEKEHSWMIHTS